MNASKESDEPEISKELIDDIKEEEQCLEKNQTESENKLHYIQKNY
jgi:hypothetical protein